MLETVRVSRQSEGKIFDARRSVGYWRLPKDRHQHLDPSGKSVPADGRE